MEKAKRPLPDEWLEQNANENSEPYRRFLYWLVLELKPQITVELGIGTAHATSHMAAAAKTFGGHVYGFDDRQIRVPTLQERFPNMHLQWCDSLGGARVMEGKKVGLVFQDSSHHGEPSRCEWNYWKSLLALGAVWICDDISPSFKMYDEPFGMVDYWDWLPVERKKLYEIGRPGNNIGVVLT